MRALAFIGLCLIFNSCGTGGNSNHRTYVITHANETTAESKAVTESPSD